jgi:excinuclease UvrABC nuclease subunit
VQQSSLEIFDQHLDYDRAGDFEAFLKLAPAKWVVYLLADADDRPVQLLCVKNLRSSLKRRLGPGEDLPARSKRVDYRELIRRVHWRRVDSAFEADAVYLEAARAFFPQTYRGMTGFQPAWFLHVNPDANFPRYTKTIDLSERPGLLIGPVEDKHAAARLIEDTVDRFDLCRYYNILVQSPNTTACAYKEMGKCPAPCDGTISMDHYRGLVEWSARTMVAPAELIRDNTRRMESAARELKFEQAAKIKQYIDSLAQLGRGPFRHVRSVRDFQFLALQRGPRAGLAKAFLITPGQIEEIAGLIDAPAQPAELMRLALELASQRQREFVDSIGAERIGVVAHHLFLAKATHGVFIPLGVIEEKTIAKGYRDLLKQKVEPENEGEGVVKELQAI